LRTTVGTDWLAQLAGGGGATSTGTGTTAPTATTITLDGVSAPGSTTAYNDRIITCGGVYGVVQSNTNAAPPVLTVDKWYTPSSPGGAAAGTPAAGVWIILPGAAPMWWMALSTDGTAPAAGDSPLPSEISANGLGRAVATYAHTGGTSTFTLTKTFTCTGGSTTVAKIGLGCSSAAASRNIYSTAEQAPNPALGSGDTLAQTETLTES
jgi:hypothetical protein